MSFTDFAVPCERVAVENMRKRKRKMDKGKEARRRARIAAAAPAGTRVIADKRKKGEKHRGRWLDEV